MLLLAVCVLSLLSVASTQQDLKNAYVLGSEKLTVKMFYELSKANKDKSFVMSGYSLMEPLSELIFASKGDTRDQILQALNLKDENEIRQAIPLVKADMRTLNEDVTLQEASKVYVGKNYKVKSEFQSEIQKVFDSRVENVDFSQSVLTAKEINEWVANETNNKIQDLVQADSLNDMTVAMLVNALYFKGAWKDSFDKEKTREKDFFLTKDNKKSIEFMHKTDDFHYGESKDLDAKILEIPFKGNGTSLVVILPNELEGITALSEKLQDPSAFAKATEKLFKYEVEVALPKFKIETTTDLVNDVLLKMGVSDIFDANKANLSNLVEGESNVFISSAQQKAFIEINEEGAEAAAANEYDLVATSLAIGGVMTFNANHPFIFFLKQKRSDNILFSGVYCD